MDNMSLQQEDLEQIAVLYDYVREFNRKFNPENDKKLATLFDNHVKNVILDLNSPAKADNSESVLKEYIIKVFINSNKGKIRFIRVSIFQIT